jgi:hypothetical protein
MSGGSEPRVSQRDVICGSGGAGNPEVGLQGETTHTQNDIQEQIKTTEP